MTTADRLADAFLRLMDDGFLALCAAFDWIETHTPAWIAVPLALTLLLLAAVALVPIGLVARVVMRRA